MKLASAAIALIPFISLVSAHGRLLQPKALDDKFHRLDAAKVDCGPGVDVAAGGPATADFKSGSTTTLQWFILNGDGAGPLEVSIDPTGTGKNFQKAVITKNVIGKNGAIQPGQKKKAPVDFSFTVPNVKCAATGCLLKVNQDIAADVLKKKGKIGGFGSCSIINIDGTGNKNVDLTPAPLPADKKGKGKKGKGKKGKKGAKGAKKAAKKEKKQKKKEGKAKAAAGGAATEKNATEAGAAARA
ncbi:hypothetical protein HDU97_003786 [Phlyctochytrium planicorne]|nr:hypothetical protein HDU97_003786 [Phlyctochytrium planicorne]